MTVPSLGTHVQAPRRRQWRLPTRRGRERAAHHKGGIGIGAYPVASGVKFSNAPSDPGASRNCAEQQSGGWFAPGLRRFGAETLQS